MNKKPKDHTPDAPAADDVHKTVDGVEVYEPHKHERTRFKASDVVYGLKKPCLLADGTMPEVEGKTTTTAD